MKREQRQRERQRHADAWNARLGASGLYVVVTGDDEGPYTINLGRLAKRRLDNLLPLVAGLLGEKVHPPEKA